MERATGNEVGAPSLEGDEVTDDIDNLRRVQYLGDGILRNHLPTVRLSYDNPHP